MTSNRTLVLCFDGTGDSYNTDNTNVVRLFSALEKGRSDKQLVYYQPGIGTYVSPNVLWSKSITKLFKSIDYILAWYLDEHIQAGYRFLMNNYREGDKIIIFGFSRGAYTARCLAGMLDKVGLLPKSNEEQITFAYQKYTDTTKGSAQSAAGFKAAFSRTVQIEFMGVWETVSAVGLQNRTLPFSASDRVTVRFRQALSLDEHRVKFKQNPWHKPSPGSQAADADADAGENPDGYGTFEQEPVRPANVKEVWFAGCHTDVGGGSFVNSTEYLLSNITLRWMITELIEADTGVLFSDDAFARAPAFELLSVTATDPTPKVRTQRLASEGVYATSTMRGSLTQRLGLGKSALHEMEASEAATTIVSVQETELSKDVTSPPWDALAGFSWYWILEWIPMRHHIQDADGRWHTEIYINNGRGRKIQDPNPVFHSTVQLREKEDPGYKPRATWTGTPRYVD